MTSQKLSHYRILDKLGAGGMGEVYLAEDTRINRKVTIKFLPNASASDPQAKKRLIREAQLRATVLNSVAVREVVAGSNSEAQN